MPAQAKAAPGPPSAAGVSTDLFAQQQRGPGCRSATLPTGEPHAFTPGIEAYPSSAEGGVAARMTLFVAGKRKSDRRIFFPASRAASFSKITMSTIDWSARKHSVVSVALCHVSRMLSVNPKDASVNPPDAAAARKYSPFRRRVPSPQCDCAPEIRAEARAEWAA